MKDNKFFLDTNIIVYAYDISAGDKHRHANDLLIELWETQKGIISTQVLQEFFIVTTKKIPAPLEKTIAKQIITDFLQWEMVINEPEDIIEAIELHNQKHFSFWDALIIQSAIKGNASFLLSEDLTDGIQINGVTIKNPFRHL